WRAMLNRHGFTTEIASFYVDQTQLRRWEAVSRWTAGILDSVSGGRMNAAGMQRTLGLRQFQNRFTLPPPAAPALARRHTQGLEPVRAELTEATSGCLAIRCRRQ